jgi:tetratricopeptide (TPR) repeat protein
MSRKKIDTGRIEDLLGHSREHKPPAWLKQEIMTRVTHREKNYLQRILDSLRRISTVRVNPVQLGVTMAIAVLAFWAGTMTSTDDPSDRDSTQITIPADITDDAMANYLVGRGLLAANQHQPALEYLSKAAKLQPERAEFVHWQGVAFWAAGNHESERQSYYRSMENRPEYVPSLVNLGHSYLESGSYQTALQYYQQALKNDPSHPEALYNSALAYQMLNDVEQERRAFSSYLEFYRSGKWAQRAVKHLHWLGDFSFRSYKIGGRRFVFNMEALLDTHSSRHGREVDLLARTVNNTKGNELHIVFYNHDHKAKARTAALSLRQQLLRQLDPQTTPPLRISWFEAAETVTLMSGRKKQLSPSLLIFTHSLDTNNRRNST